MLRLLRRTSQLAGLCLLGSCALRCTEAIQVGLELDNAGGAGSGGGPSGGGPSAVDAAADEGDAALPTKPAPCERAACGAMFYRCGNCDDDDGDGRIDAADPECLGPCDDSESELVTGIPTTVRGNCLMDCYFDRNAGFGDDECAGSFRCDPLSVGPDYPPSGLTMCGYDPARPECSPNAEQILACQEGCLALTPNGCDCFGCCELPARSGNFVWLGSDAQASCTPVESCQNPCEDCELCVGQPELPPGCGTGGEPLPACPNGNRPCDPDEALGCGPIEYCITGCCVPLPR